MGKEHRCKACQRKQLEERERRIVDSWLCVFGEDVFCPHTDVPKEKRMNSVCVGCNHFAEFEQEMDEEEAGSFEVVEGNLEGYLESEIGCIENVPIFRGRLGSVVVLVHSDYASFGLAGHGEVTNANCGRFKVAYGCDRVELHNHVGLDGINYADKVYVKKVFMSCDKPSCPICYKFGWAVREGKKIGVRLEEASKTYGEVLHLSISIPLSWYALPFKVLVKRVWDALVERGAIGGVLIFHRDRFRGSNHSEPHWSFHFHFLGFVPERGKCRACKEVCFKGCGGFVDQNYRLNEKDGLLVKVLGKRKTIAGTAWYQLHHSSYKTNAKRASVVRWMGVCSYRNLKVVVKKHEETCPACGHDLVRLAYFGNDPVVRAWLYASRDPEVKEKRSGWFLADEDGRRVWVPIVGSWGDSGSSRGYDFG